MIASGNRWYVVRSSDAVEGQAGAALLVDFGLDPSRGFLSASDPLSELPSVFAPWEALAREMPGLLAARRLRDALEAIEPLETETLSNPTELERAMLLLSYFCHGYVWGGDRPADRIPDGIAVPWFSVAQRLGRPPVLSYASYALNNWRRIDPQGPVAIGNITLLQRFLGGQDEEWFILVHVDIEARAGVLPGAAAEAQAAVQRDDAQSVERQLTIVAETLRSMHATLSRMPERCDPYIYYRRVRPYIHGWKDNPALSGGVVYEGVEEWRGRPQRFRGETGAQSSLVPLLDAALGVGHADDPLRPYLMEMRSYMPPNHRRFIEAIEAGPSVRNYVLARRESGSLVAAYNDCVEWLAQFRSRHLEFADVYIHRQAEGSARNPTGIGTGGTPFMAYLKKHRDETMEHIIE